MSHQGHCCLKHGCKYRSSDCPVALGYQKQDHECEASIDMYEDNEDSCFEEKAVGFKLSGNQLILKWENKKTYIDLSNEQVEIVKKGFEIDKEYYVESFKKGFFDY